jgi:hypothetical protein
MPNYRIVFTSQEGATPIRAVSFAADDPHEALLIAQRHDCAAELWEEGEHVCTLNRAGNDHEFWVITAAQKPKP